MLRCSNRSLIRPSRVLYESALHPAASALQSPPMKKDSKLCNFRLAPETVDCLVRLAETWACSQTEAVTRALLIAEAAVNATPEAAEEPDSRLATAEAAMNAVELKPTTPPLRKRVESVAERRAREAKEHAQKLAEADTMAQITGRDDIEYDLENVPHRSVLHVAADEQKARPKTGYKVVPRDSKPLNRPHGSTEAKRRREQ
jgi:hypothetical protein